MKPNDPVPIKLIFGILYSDPGLLIYTQNLLEHLYGPVDYKSTTFAFEITDYYNEEMGLPIHREFWSFETLRNPKELAIIKIESNAIENELAIDGERKVNLDPGYLDYDKFVLASAKYAGHKVYLDHGIYADTTLMYAKGMYHPSDFAFPDFRSGIYNPVFMKIRDIYKKGLRAENS